jgi:dihydrofolate reductase
VLMAKVVAGITMSVDGYITGPDDGPGKGLGDGGERLHSWVFGGPWSYADGPRGEPAGEDAAWLAEVTSRVGAVVGGRWTYEAARHWGDENPWDLPFFIVTHRPQEQPEGGAFTFVSGVEAAVERALDAAGGKDVNVMGGADVIRQALAAGIVDELTIIVAPVVLGGGKRLFEGFSQSLDLEHRGVRQSPFATFIDYAVVGGSGSARHAMTSRADTMTSAGPDPSSTRPG